MIIKHIKAPEQRVYKLFLSGGITGASNWQKAAAEVIDTWKVPIILYNPRRDEWKDLNIGELEKQIRWEHEAIRSADGVLFWFPEEALCPITLFELGAQMELREHSSLFIGCPKGFYRSADIAIQSRIHRKAYYTFETLENTLNEAYFHIVNSLSL